MTLPAAGSKRDKVLVLGSGPIRIGQGIEFDYCSVHSVWAIKESGREAIILIITRKLFPPILIVPINFILSR